MNGLPAEIEYKWSWKGASRFSDHCFAFISGLVHFFCIITTKGSMESSRVCHLCSCGHACGVSAVVHGLDKKQNKPEWSGEGWSQIKRFKASFASDYLMPIRGDRRWSSVRSSRCRRKSTSLSASGRISTVSHVKAPPHPPHATAEQTEKMSFSSSVSDDLLVFVVFVSASKTKHSKWFMLPSRLKHSSIQRLSAKQIPDQWHPKASQHILLLLPVRKQNGANHNPTCSVTTLLFPS